MIAQRKPFFFRSRCFREVIDLLAAQPQEWEKLQWTFIVPPKLIQDSARAATLFHRVDGEYTYLFDGEGRKACFETTASLVWYPDSKGVFSLQLDPWCVKSDAGSPSLVERLSAVLAGEVVKTYPLLAEPPFFGIPQAKIERVSVQGLPLLRLANE